MNKLKYTFLSIFISVNAFAYFNNPNLVINNDKSQKIIGTWQIDLRPTPESDPYFKNFIIEKLKGKEFSGEFYNTKFKNGYINTSWGKIYFGFTTKDKRNTYFHSGTISENTIEGITYCPEREFTSYWTGIKKQ